MTEEISPLTDSTSLLGNPPALRSRGEADGYLFFKRLLPANDVLTVRRELLEIVEDHGWCADGPERPDGSLNLAALDQVPDEEMRLDIGVSIRAYQDVQKREKVHRLPHHPVLLRLYRDLFGSPVLVHPRHIVRMITAHRSMIPTPAHQDFPLIQGAVQTWTCWIPLGDCPEDMGGLRILKGSHKLGCLPIQSTPGAGGLEAQLCPREGDDWLGGAYEIGDVLTFPSFTVHRGSKNHRRDQIRLSMDVRYQSAHEVIEERSFKPHCELDWDEIYAGWEKDDLKYYWRNSSQMIVPWDDSLHQPQRRIC